jgi:hypothetical protein
VHTQDEPRDPTSLESYKKTPLKEIPSLRNAALKSQMKGKERKEVKVGFFPKHNSTTIQEQVGSHSVCRIAP